MQKFGGPHCNEGNIQVLLGPGATFDCVLILTASFTFNDIVEVIRCELRFNHVFIYLVDYCEGRNINTNFKL
jgi:hypothetical protein